MTVLVIEPADLVPGIRVAVDQLTVPTQTVVVREDGTRVFALVPALWDQAMDALAGGSEGSARLGSSLSERSPLDLALLGVVGVITTTVRHELISRGQLPPYTIPQGLRLLAAYVIKHEVGDLWWWSYRFASWARLIANHLSVTEHHRTDIRLRSAPCPACHVRQVIIESENGPVVVPPLVIKLRDGYVRGAECSSCGMTWWRGADLNALADLLAQT